MCSFLLYLFFFFFLYLILKVNQTQQQVIGQQCLPHLAPSHTGREEAPLPAPPGPSASSSGWPPTSPSRASCPQPPPQGVFNLLSIRSFLLFPSLEIVHTILWM